MAGAAPPPEAQMAAAVIKGHDNT
eukprot:COSAG02_NODE_43566_length_373_cov_1.251825_1_plen_23_part_10